MSLKHYFVVVCCFAIVSCKTEPSLTFKETTVSMENNSIVEVNIPLAEGSGDIANTINSTIKNKVIQALQIGDPDEPISIQSIEESMEAFNKEFEGFQNDFPDSGQEWEAQIDGDIMFQSADIISMALTCYMNTGGAHGNLNILFLNFNAHTGKTISNDKLFNDKKAFYRLAKTYFEDSIKDKEAVFDPENFVLPANIGYSDIGIILLYNTYEIAAYSDGVIEFTIPYDKVNSLLVFNNP